MILILINTLYLQKLYLQLTSICLVGILLLNQIIIKYKNQYIMKIIFENEKVALRFNHYTNAVEMIWKQHQDTETYKMIFTKALESIKYYRAIAFFSDIRKEGVVGPESSKWVQEEIMQKAFSYGMKKVAVVMDSDIFKKFYIQNLEKAAKSDSLKYFDSVEAANKWILED